MTEIPEDFPKTLEEMLRHLMESIQGGDSRPIFIGMKIIVSPGGDFSHNRENIRGDATEPSIEVHRLGDRVVLVTEMPGMAPENIHLLFRDDRVFLWARDQERHYNGSARVPPAQQGSEEISYRHGILEISYLPVEGDTPKDTPNPL